MAKLIGNAPNQVPTNADLGSMAFEDKKNYATISSSIHQPYRNIIINGDMSIAQRGTSTASITTTGYYTVDRFQTFLLNSLGTWTQSQDSDVPTGQGFAKSLKMDCTTAAASPAAGGLLFLSQGFEGQNLQYLKFGTASAQSITLSFWVKSNKTGTYICELRNNDNLKNISQSYTINSASTWEKKTLTFVGDTSGTLDNDNNSSLDCYFWLGAGTNFTSGTLNTSWNTTAASNRAVGQVNLADSTSNYINITGVQLEAGTTASDFEFLPVDVNLQRCMRYCLVIGDTPNGLDFSKQGIIGHYFSATAFILEWFFQYPMRATPSFSVSSVSLGTVYSNGGSFSVTNVSNNTQSPTTWGPSLTTSSATAGNAGHFDFGSQYAILSAEL